MRGACAAYHAERLSLYEAASCGSVLAAGEGRRAQQCHCSVDAWCLYAGVIQCTERDEFSYQEMIAHLPLCALEVRVPERIGAAKLGTPLD